MEKAKLLSDEKKITETLTNFLKNTVDQLGINGDEAKFDDKPALSQKTIDVVIEKFKNHPSVKLIRDNNLSDMLKLESGSLDILREVANLNSAKNSTFNYKHSISFSTQGLEYM